MASRRDQLVQAAALSLLVLRCILAVLPDLGAATISLSAGSQMVHSLFDEQEGRGNEQTGQSAQERVTASNAKVLEQGIGEQRESGSPCGSKQVVQGEHRSHVRVIYIAGNQLRPGAYKTARTQSRQRCTETG